MISNKIFCLQKDFHIFEKTLMIMNIISISVVIKVIYIIDTRYIDTILSIRV